MVCRKYASCTPMPKKRRLMSNCDAIICKTNHIVQIKAFVAKEYQPATGVAIKEASCGNSAVGGSLFRAEILQYMKYRTETVNACLFWCH